MNDLCGGLDPSLASGLSHGSAIENASGKLGHPEAGPIWGASRHRHRGRALLVLGHPNAESTMRWPPFRVTRRPARPDAVSTWGQSRHERLCSAAGPSSLEAVGSAPEAVWTRRELARRPTIPGAVLGGGWTPRRSVITKP